MAPLEVPARQWFELLVEDELDREAERLVSLGATAIGARRVGGDRGDVVVLADPDGNEFRLRTDQRRQSSRRT